MATLDKLCGFGREVEVGGDVFYVSPISLAILGKMQLWVERRPLDQARHEIEEFGDLYTEQRKADIIEAARERVLQIRKVRERREPDEDKVAEVGKYMAAVMDSVEGCTQLIYYCLLPKHPDATLSDAERLVDTIGIDATAAMIDEINETPKHPLDDLVEKKTRTSGLNRTGAMFIAAWLVRMAGRLLRLAAWVSRKFTA